MSSGHSERGMAEVVGATAFGEVGLATRRINAHTVWLTPTEAREVARALLHAADDAIVQQKAEAQRRAEVEAHA